jgi:light-regulated signal transduction histidine kinase (bacteriophytochrome)
MKRYAIAVLGVASSTAIGSVLDPIFHHREEFLIYLFATGVIALRAGLWPGLAATVGGGLICDYLFVDPRYSVPLTLNNTSSLLVFLLLGGALSMLGDRLLRTEQRLAKANARLAATNEEMERFGSVISHDLRSPLRSMQSFTDLLARRAGPALDTESAQYLQFIQEGAQRMGRLIDAVLRYSRVPFEAQDESEPTDCTQAVHEVLESLRSQISESGAIVTVGPLPTVRANPDLLVQLFQNLIGNAIKYRGSQQPRIHIDAIRGRNFITFSVSDNGIGIAKEYAGRIFDPFQRLHRQDEYEGAGLGLATCRRIVERHGGRIWVESEPGIGSTFFLTLPSSRIVYPPG